MDVDARRAYVALRMNLLLFLSAILSALTGAVTGTRAPQPVHVASARIVAVAEAGASAVTDATARPAQALASLAVSAGAPAMQALDIASAVPIFAGRRRE